MNNKPLVLVVEDDEGLNNLICKSLIRAGFDSDGALSGKDAIERLKKNDVSVMLLDYKLPDMTSRELVDQQGADGMPPFIIITGHGDEKIAVEMMKLGARDYIVKSSGLLEILPHIVERTVREFNRERELERAESELLAKTELSRALLDSLPCVAFLLKADTHEIIASNKIAEETGRKPISKCYEIWGDRKDPCPWCLAPALWKTGKKQHLEVECDNAVWDTYWIPISKDVYLHYALDISEQRKAKEEINERIQELEKFYEMAVGRELKMKSLKAEITKLNKQIDMMQGKVERSRQASLFTASPQTQTSISHKKKV